MNSLSHAFHRLMYSADIPVAFDRSLPEIRLSAMRELVIEPHRGVRSFSQDSVLIETGGGLIHLKGESLVIKRMTWRELRLQGQIRALELIVQNAV